MHFFLSFRFCNVWIKSQKVFFLAETSRPITRLLGSWWKCAKYLIRYYSYLIVLWCFYTDMLGQKACWCCPKIECPSIFTIMPNYTRPKLSSERIGIWVNSKKVGLLPPANEVWGKVIFSKACVKNSVHGRGGGGCILVNIFFSTKYILSNNACYIHNSGTKVIFSWTKTLLH